jgi:hypothetical protein
MIDILILFSKTVSDIKKQFIFVNQTVRIVNSF